MCLCWTHRSFCWFFRAASHSMICEESVFYFQVSQHLQDFVVKRSQNIDFSQRVPTSFKEDVLNSVRNNGHYSLMFDKVIIPVFNVSVTETLII